MVIQQTDQIFGYESDVTFVDATSVVQLVIHGGWELRVLVIIIGIRLLFVRPFRLITSRTLKKSILVLYLVVYLRYLTTASCVN